VEPEFDDDFSDIEIGEVRTAPKVSTSRGTRKPAGRRPAAKKLSDLQVKLSSQMFQAGTMIGFGLPVTGYFLAQESDNFTGAIVNLASRKTEWVKALEQIADIEPGITIGRVVLGFGFALSVDRNKEGLEYMSPRFQRIAAFLGVAAAYNSVYGQDNASVQAGSFIPPPGKYEPVA